MRKKTRRRVNKNTKSYKLRQEYNKAYRNYMRRVSTQTKKGYIVPTIQKVKNPTEASIRRIKSMTAKEIISRSEIYDILNDRYLSPGQSGRGKALKDNKAFFKLSPFEQEISLSIKSLDRDVIANITVETPDEPADEIDALIEKWYETIEDFNPKVQADLRERTDELIRRDRIAFANVIENHGGLLPATTEYKGQIISAAFNAISNVMDWSRSSGELERFMNSYGIVENE
jgi:hypothetical protein